MALPVVREAPWHNNIAYWHSGLWISQKISQTITVVFFFEVLRRRSFGVLRRGQCRPRLISSTLPRIFDSTACRRLRPTVLTLTRAVDSCLFFLLPVTSVYPGLHFIVLLFPIAPCSPCFVSSTLILFFWFALICPNTENLSKTCMPKMYPCQKSLASFAIVIDHVRSYLLGSITSSSSASDLFIQVQHLQHFLILFY